MQYDLSKTAYIVFTKGCLDTYLHRKLYLMMVSLESELLFTDTIARGKPAIRCKFFADAHLLFIVRRGLKGYICIPYLAESNAVIEFGHTCQVDASLSDDGCYLTLEPQTVI